MHMRKLCVLLLALALVICTAYIPDRSEAAGVGGTDVVGSVVNETWAPFPGVEIQVVNYTNPGTVFKAVTDQGGNYSMPGNFIRGLYNVTAVLTNYTANTTYTGVLVALGEVVRLNFTMNEVLCTLTGLISNGTAPVNEAIVTLIGEGGNYSGKSDQFGRYTVSNVRPGWYTARAAKVGYYPTEAGPPVNMVRGEIAELDFTMREQEARSLSGTVKYDGDGLSGVSVVLTSVNAPYSIETMTDSDGNYSFLGVPVGSYSITFSKENFLESRYTLGLSLNESRKLDVQLRYDSANNTQTFLFGLDLAHSLMVIGLVVSLLVLVLGLYLNNRIRRKPELLDRGDGSSEK